MQLHQIKPIHEPEEKKRIGRGGKRGTYSGRGMKGQKSRAGSRIRPAWRDLLKKIPKKRGYKFKEVSEKIAIINLADIEKKFKGDEVVSPAALAEKGLIRKVKGKIPTIKILGTGQISKKLSFQNFRMSRSVNDRLGNTKKEIVPKSKPKRLLRSVKSKTRKVSK